MRRVATCRCTMIYGLFPVDTVRAKQIEVYTPGPSVYVQALKFNSKNLGAHFIDPADIRNGKLVLQMEKNQRIVIGLSHICIVSMKNGMFKNQPKETHCDDVKNWV